jgi:hypothetical protein
MGCFFNKINHNDDHEGAFVVMVLGFEQNDLSLFKNGQARKKS